MGAGTAIVGSGPGSVNHRPTASHLPARIWQAIDHVVTTSLALNPDDRYPTPVAWLNDIEQVYRDLQPQRRLSPLAERLTGFVAWLADRIRGQ